MGKEKGQEMKPSGAAYTLAYGQIQIIVHCNERKGKDGNNNTGEGFYKMHKLLNSVSAQQYTQLHATRQLGLKQVI